MSQYTWVYCDQRKGSWARVGAGLGVAAGAQQALGRGGTARECAGRWRAAWERRACSRRGVAARVRRPRRARRAGSAAGAAGRRAAWARGLAMTVHSVHST